MFDRSQFGGLRNPSLVARRVLMHVPEALGLARSEHSWSSSSAAFAARRLRARRRRRRAARRGACVCECHFASPGGGLSSEVWLGILVLVERGLLRPAVRAVLRVFGGLLREAERAFGAAPPPRPLHLPPP